MSSGSPGGRRGRGSPLVGGGSSSVGSRQEPRSGANYRRGERSDLVKTWMMRNDKGATDPSKSKELKAQYAEALKIRKEEFWDTIKRYALRSKDNSIPDFEQIFHHIRDDSKLDYSDLKMGDTALEFWWQLDADQRHIRPITDNLKNFKPSSGLLHHFYSIFIYNPAKCDEIFKHSERLGASRWKHPPDELLRMIEREDPFRSLPEPKALFIVPKMNQALRGTYALAKKINGNNIYIRPQRKPAQVSPDRVAVDVSGFRLEVPIEKTGNYATSENALVLYCKEEKRGGDGASESSYRDVPMRLKVPSSQTLRPIEATIPSLHDQWFDTHDAIVYPIRTLVPPPYVAHELDYAAVWTGVFSPFPRTSASVEEVAVQFPTLAPEVFNFLFQIGETEHFTSSSSTPAAASQSTHMGHQIKDEEYVRLLTWFANYDQGFGQDECNVLALYQSLVQDGMPFSILSKNDELVSRGDIGAFNLRLGTSKIGYLVFEVLVTEEQVLCHRVKVTFVEQQVEPHMRRPPCNVTFELEKPDGTVVATQTNTLQGDLMSKVQWMSELPNGVNLHPFLKEIPKAPMLSRTLTNTTPMHTSAALPIETSPGKRKFSDITPATANSSGIIVGPSLSPDDNGVDSIDGGLTRGFSTSEGQGEVFGQQFVIPPGGISREHSLNPFTTMAPPYVSSASQLYPMAPPDAPGRGQSSSQLLQQQQQQQQQQVLMPIPAETLVGRETSIGALSDLLYGFDGIDGIDRQSSIANLADLHAYPGHEEAGEEAGNKRIKTEVPDTTTSHGV